MKLSLNVVGVNSALCLLFLTNLSPSATADEAPVSGPRHPLAAPLPKDDPNAQLDPALCNIPPMPTPRYSQNARSLNLRSGLKEVAYDIATGRVTIAESSWTRQPLNRAGAREVEEGYIGFDGRTDGGLRDDPGRQSGGVGFQTVFGVDDRVRIDDTTLYPWRTHCKLIMTFRNGRRFVGSGTLISDKYVLTAGHNVYDHGRANDGRRVGWATQVEVIPGLDGTYKPYGSAFAVYLRSIQGWVRDQDPRHDFALVTLDRKIGASTGWLGYGNFALDKDLHGHLSGYPGDRDNGQRQYYDKRALSDWSKFQVFYRIDTAAGQSGSGVWLNENGKRYVCAVHARGGVDYNEGTRLESNTFRTIQTWIASGK